MTHDIVLVLFCITMIANAIALARHWYMMRLMRATLNGLIESQNQYAEMIKDANRARNGPTA